MKQIKNNLKQELNKYQQQLYNNNINTNEIKSNKEYEKGCLWMAEKCDEEICELDQTFDELLIEYQNRLKNAENEKNDENSEYYLRLINNCIKWFFSTLKCNINDIKNKMDNWKTEIKNKNNFS